jgi:hypothetical protein
MSDIGFKGKVPGAWRVPTDFCLTDHVSTDLNPTVLLPDLAFFIKDALSNEDCAKLRALFAMQESTPVAVSGYQTADPNEIGSMRATGWGPELSLHLWSKIWERASYGAGEGSESGPCRQGRLRSRRSG